jgi:CHAD domain-containing protein
MTDVRLAAQQSVYIAPGELSSEEITRSLLALLPTRHHLVTKHRFTVLDTFDARVQRAGAYLTRAGTEGAPTVNWQTGSGISRSIRLNCPLSFAWDLPDGPLRQQVTSVIGPRRLLAQADAEEQGSILDMIDDRGKTVARLRIASGHVKPPTPDSAWRPFPTTVTLTGLRGYEKAYERLVPVIESRPGIQSCPDGPTGVMLRHIGAMKPRDVGVLDNRPEPTMRADVGARQIQRALLEVLVTNEPGLRASLDTEFLHDFRVAVRRARTLLGQIRGVFPADIVEHFKIELSWIGRVTGPPRDTDVLVLALREHFEEFSEDDRETLIAFLSRTQQQEYDQLMRALDSGRYRRLLADWRAFLESPIRSDSTAPHATESLAAIVSHRAWRLSKRISRTVKHVDELTPADRLHEIRIDAKKLRYLLDVMPACYEIADMQCILGVLKKLQSALGDFNDAHVQEKLLLDWGRALGNAGGPSGALLTFGRLAEQSRHRREHMREDLVDRLSRFTANKVRKACRRAFKNAYYAGSMP